ncbi:hypothetical protein Si103_01689 [Streptococcus infantarius subsp. infantarius]|jgi:uncharacterized membrane protein|uniref:Uncharacterized protein n=2 Tax=Streptococcus equinus TaxID=1335 RepID=A0A091BV79_STREI|nr:MULTISPECIES: hypothetical protein [Streptococcus]AEZ63056.1 hypothetical protein Sinf_1763 [Streptococcus infantarius subsp. infantarius CJ18]KFN88644.1 hypothetical protein H702_02250 [Streptococcus equinus JB1]MBK8155210.1 hypothetical protein [Streptococcus sp.]MBT0897121.1 hypothetical protein [Streptococcus infantarius subsp. infantarius]MBT0900414.1 hypothetical protein [Streptococcus infantarius subsp. infantarius]
MKEISIYVRIIDLILLVLAFLDSGVKSVLILAAVIFFLSALMQVIMSYKRVKLSHHV